MFAELALASGIAASGGLAWLLRARLRRERAQAGALRRALEARDWEERALEPDSLQATVQELRRRSHEANNAFSTALLSAQYLLDQSRAEPFSEALRAELVSAASGMVDALQKLRVQLDRGPKPATPAGPRSDLVRAVELWPALEDCAARARTRHGRVSIELLEPDAALRRARVAVCAGSIGLERALDGVLDNAAACARTRVAIRAAAQLGVDVVAIEVQDDGPGFAAAALERRIAPFDSTRPGALGLGLYTAERILRASLGSLRRENAEDGGARVSLFLPLAIDTRDRDAPGDGA